MDDIELPELAGKIISSAKITRPSVHEQEVALEFSDTVMMRLDKIIKPWKDAGSLNANVNLYGFWDETTFLTKSGDLGIVLKVCGVDFESLDQAGQEFAVRRLEAALKSFGPGFHVYQYLFKTNRPDMPFAKYGDPLIDAAVEQRREFFESKRDRLYSIEIFYAVVLGPVKVLVSNPLYSHDHQQANRDDIAAEIADSVQYVVQVQRYAHGRKISETVQVLGYDRILKTFEFKTVFNRADEHPSAQLTLPAEWARFTNVSSKLTRKEAERLAMTGSAKLGTSKAISTKTIMAGCISTPPVRSMTVRGCQSHARPHLRTRATFLKHWTMLNRVPSAIPMTKDSACNAYDSGLSREQMER